MDLSLSLSVARVLVMIKTRETPSLGTQRHGTGSGTRGLPASLQRFSLPCLLAIPKPMTSTGTSDAGQRTRLPAPAPPSLAPELKA